LSPLADAITERSRGSWHLHADETTWRVFASREGDGPAKWWLWVFIEPDTVCFFMSAMPPGSYLVISHITGEQVAAGASRDAQAVYAHATARVHPRTRGSSTACTVSNRAWSRSARGAPAASGPCTLLRRGEQPGNPRVT
jgi:Transposase IS66 family